MAEENEVILAWGDAQGKGRTTLAQLEEWINSPKENTEKIADFVYWRLYERYIRPFEILIEHENSDKEKGNVQIDSGQDEEPNEQEETQKCFKFRIGFAIMANMCPVIEALEAFKHGKERFYNEKEKKELDNAMSYEDAFIDFFTGEKEKEKERERERERTFNVPENFGKEFYENIRCRILHQGGTGGGWRIKHIGDNKIIDVDAKIIDAKKFLDKIKKILENYGDDLKNGREDINNCVTKCKAIISNC